MVADDCGWRDATARAWLPYRSCTLCAPVRIASHPPGHSALRAPMSMAAIQVALQRLSRPSASAAAGCQRTPCGCLPFSSFPASCSFRQPCLCRVTDVNRKPNRCTVQTKGRKREKEAVLTSVYARACTDAHSIANQDDMRDEGRPIRASQAACTKKSKPPGIANHNKLYSATVQSMKVHTL